MWGRNETSFLWFFFPFPPVCLRRELMWSPMTHTRLKELPSWTCHKVLEGVWMRFSHVWCHTTKSALPGSTLLWKRQKKEKKIHKTVSNLVSSWNSWLYLPSLFLPLNTLLVENSSFSKSTWAYPWSKCCLYLVEEVMTSWQCEAASTLVPLVH